MIFIKKSILIGQRVSFYGNDQTRFSFKPKDYQHYRPFWAHKVQEQKNQPLKFVATERTTKWGFDS